MVHYADLIKMFGAPNGLCSSITESKHIVAVKKPWRRSNRYNALGQMLLTNERLDKLHESRERFKVHGMLTHDYLGFDHTIKDVIAPSVDELDSDSDEDDGQDSTEEEEEEEGDEGRRKVKWKSRDDGTVHGPRTMGCIIIASTPRE